MKKLYNKMSFNEWDQFVYIDDIEQPIIKDILTHNIISHNSFNLESNTYNSQSVSIFDSLFYIPNTPFTTKITFAIFYISLKIKCHVLTMSRRIFDD